MNKNQAKKQFNCSNSDPVLAILGGSQGSVPLNHHFQKHYSQYTDSGIQILWQCGKNDYDDLKDSVHNKKIHLLPFSDDMSALYSASDLIVSRVKVNRRVFIEVNTMSDFANRTGNSSMRPT